LVSHSKAAPDSLAVFLNDLLALGYNGGNRDFRRDTFKKELASSRASLEPESSDGNHNYCCDESDALFHAGTD